MNYFLQKNCSTCQIITFLNAYIHKFGTSPLQYDTPEYEQFVLDKCGGHYENGILYYVDFTPIIELVKANVIPFQFAMGKTESIKRFMIKQLNEGNLIDFTAYVRGLHSFLITEYDKNFDSFKCINGRFFTNKTPVEWLSYDVITKIGYYGNSSYIQKAKLKPFNSIFKNSKVISF